MNEVNPDPISNENKKSVIASFEHIDNESGFWCRESFTITNRMSRLYKGQDGDIYIFSRAGPTSESEWKVGEKQFEGTNDIQLHLFSFVINPLNYEFGMKILENIDKAIEKKFEKKIDPGLLSEFTKEINEDY